MRLIGPSSVALTCFMRHGTLNYPLLQVEAAEPGSTWALLVAGSNGWENYSDQANVCHLYRLLLERGVPAEHIVTVMWDDIANNDANPYPGRMYDTPDISKEVYEGVRIDYRDKAVTVQNILAVLSGNKSAVVGGSGRVIESTADDHVFVYFSDHGDSGVFLVFKEGEEYDVITALELRQTLKRMHAERMYKKLTFYMDSCLSGSMFAGISEELNVYAVTGADATHDAWMKYCPDDSCDEAPFNMSLPCILYTCQGGAFSDVWIQDLETYKSKESLDDEYVLAKKEADRYIWEHVGEHGTISQYGDLAVRNESVADFFGHVVPENAVVEKRFEPIGMWRKSEAKLRMLQYRLAHAVHQEDAVAASEASLQLAELKTKHAEVDRFLARLVGTLLHSEKKQRLALTGRPRRITELECHHVAVHGFLDHCRHKLPKTAYSAKFASLLTNLCELGLDAKDIVAGIQLFCQ